MDNTRGNNPESRVRPSVLALSRQKMPNLEGTSIEGVCKGGYTVYGGEGKPDAIIMATGAPCCRSRSLSIVEACNAHLTRPILAPACDCLATQQP